MKRKWTAADVVHALRMIYDVDRSQQVQEEWTFLTEVALRSPGPSRGGTAAMSHWSSNVRTIDVLLARTWSSGVGFRRVAVEVKVSKSDYRNETDIKRQPAEDNAHHTWYAAPAGIIAVTDLPPGWGLIEVYDDPEAYAAGPGREMGSWRADWHRRDGDKGWLRCKAVKRPVLREPTVALDYLVATAMRHASRTEEQIRRGESDAHEVPRLRADVERLTEQLARRDQAVLRERERIQQVRTEFEALVGQQVCSVCEHPVKFRLSSRTWAHAQRAQEGVCAEARAEADRARKAEQYGARYSRGYAGSVIPKALLDNLLPDDY